MSIFGQSGRVYDFGPSPIIWNCGVWKSLSEKYLIPNNLVISDLIKMSASEFSWYDKHLIKILTFIVF